MLRSYSVAPSRSGRSARLWAAASLLALATATAAPQAASATDFTAGNEAQLQAALIAAGASGIPQPTIGLTGSFALTGPVTLPNKVIFLDPAGFTLTGLTFNGASTLAVSGAGIVPLVGNSSAGAFSVRTGDVRLEGGATVTAASEANVFSGGTLVVDGAGSVLTAANVSFANGGNATVTIRNGGVIHTTSTTTNSSLSVNSASDLLVTGAGSRLDIDGSAGYGTIGSVNRSLTVAAGADMTVGQGLTMGSQTAQAIAPQLTVTGAGSTLTTRTLTANRGVVSVLDGGAYTTNALNVGARTTGSATLLVSDSGSRVVATGDTVVGVTNGGTNAQGIITLANGGALEARGAFTLGGNATVTAILNIGGAEGSAAAAAGVLDTSLITFGNATSRINFNHTENSYIFAPTITGAGAITQVAGVTHLTGNSSVFSGTTNVSGGTLQIDGQLGGAVTVASGARLGGSGTLNGSVVVANGGVVAPGASPGTLNIAGNLTLNPTSRLDMEFGQQGVVGGPMNDLIKVGGALTLDGVIDVSLTSGGVFDAGLYRVVSYAGALSGPGLTLGSTPAGSTVSLQTVIPGQINLINTAGLPLNFWDGANTSANTAIDGGAGVWDASATNWTLQTGTVNSAYTPGGFAIFAGTGGAVTADNSLGVLRIGGAQFAVDGYSVAGDAIELDAGSVNIRVGDGTSDGEAFVATIDAELTGAGRLVKTDRGALVLNADNTYAGGTQVKNGTLVVNGVQAAGGGANLVSLAGTLRGSGTLGGDLTVDGALAPGGLATAGNLTIGGDLTLTSTARLNYRLGQAGVAGGALNDLLTVNGDLTLDGTLNVTQTAGGTFGLGIYRLIDYTGSLTNNGLELGVLPGGFANAIQTSIAGQVNLVTTPANYNFWDGDGGAAADGAVTGGNGVWRSAATNWTVSDGSSNGVYSASLFAIFAGAAGLVTVDDSNGAVGVQGMQFAANGYRVAGDSITLETVDSVVRVGDGTTAGAGFDATIESALVGAGGLRKADAGTLILTGANTYSGGTRVSQGVLRIGDGGTTGSIKGDVINEALLAFNRSDDVTFTGAITGDGTVAQIGAGTLTLNGNSAAFTGATEVRNGALAVDGSLGGVVTVMSGARLLGTGQVGGVVNQASGVVDPGRAGVVGTLTVAGNYSGAGGLLRMDATLAGDNAPADRLVVRGATSGVTPIQINRLTGSTGAPTPNGILLVQVDGVSAPDAFVLASGDYQRNGEAVMVAGAYGYVLRRDATDGDWRLRSESAGSGSGSSGALFQPGVPVYEAYPQALQLLNGVGSMRERIGSRQWSDEPGSGVWGRFEGGHTKLQQAVSTTGADLSADRWKLQFGVDPLLRDLDGGATIVGGLTAYYGEVRTGVSSPSGDGDIQTKGYGLGGALTWQGSGGGYVDAQVQAGRFDSDLSSRLAERRNDGSDGVGYAASLEAGRAFTRAALRLTPQSQLSYATVDFDSFTDGFGAVVSNDKSRSLIGRAGLAVDRDWSAGNLYAVANVSHEFLDGTRVDVSGIAVASRRERTWVGLATGGTYAWGGGRFTVYGEAAADTSAKSFGDSYQLTGTAGFRMRF